MLSEVLPDDCVQLLCHVRDAFVTRYLLARVFAGAVSRGWARFLWRKWDGPALGDLMPDPRRV